MTEFLELAEAVARHVKPGCSVAAEGFTHLIPHAAGAEIIRQEIRHLTLIRMTPDIIYDQMIGMGCADKLVFSWGGNPGVGSLLPPPRRLRKRRAARDRIRGARPRRHGQRLRRRRGGDAVRLFQGLSREPSYPEVNPNIRSVECPFTGEQLTAIPAHRPDVAIIHAQRADRQGNVWMTGILGVQKEAVLAAGVQHRHRRGDRRQRRRELRRDRHPALGGRRRVRGAVGRVPVVCRGLLRPEQRPSTRSGARSARTSTASASGCSATFWQATISSTTSPG